MVPNSPLFNKIIMHYFTAKTFFSNDKLINMDKNKVEIIVWKTYSCGATSWQCVKSWYMELGQ